MTNKKATPAIQLRLEVIRFGSADVIATSAVAPFNTLYSEKYEVVANWTNTSSFYGGYTPNTNGGYNEPTNQ